MSTQVARRSRAVSAAAALLAVSAALPGAPLAAQAPELARTVLRPASPPGSAAERADSLYDAGDVRAALELLEVHLSAAPSDFEARWRAARAAVTMGILASGTEIENRWFRRGIGHADQALAQRPDHMEALRWAAASKGRLSLQTGARETVSLAQEVWDLTHRMMELAPDDADAYNILGKLHYEVMKLSAPKRFIARVILGGDVLERASWDQALLLHGNAVALDPRCIRCRLDLADTLVRTDREDEARAQLEAALELPDRTPADVDFRYNVQLRLRELGAR